MAENRGKNWFLSRGGCWVECQVECRGGCCTNTHPYSFPVYKGISEDLGIVLAISSLKNNLRSYYEKIFP